MQTPEESDDCTRVVGVSELLSLHRFDSADRLDSTVKSPHSPLGSCGCRWRMEEVAGGDFKANPHMSEQEDYDTHCPHQLVPGRDARIKRKQTKQRNPSLQAWTTPTLVYSWPQINLPGKYNPLYHLCLISQRDVKVWRQSAACIRRVWGFLALLHENGGREQPLHADCYQRIARPSNLFLLFAFSRSGTYQGLYGLIKQILGDQSGFCLYLSLRLSVPDTNHKHSCTNNPEQFQFISWTRVNKMSTVSSPPRFRRHRWSEREAKRSMCCNR